MDETKQQKAPADEDLGIDLYDLFYLFRQKLVGILIALVLVVFALGNTLPGVGGRKKAVSG